MYIVKHNSNNLNNKTITKLDFINLDGFVMPSKNKYFLINSERITDIKIVDETLITSIINKRVKRKYQRLIKEITNLLIEENDDEGSTMHQVLDRIEKFRQEIKFKYRSYLNKKELAVMAKQLRALQSEAKKRFAELKDYNYTTSKGRGR